MSEQQSVSGNKSAKFGIKHVGLAGGLVAAMYILEPAKKFFFTREEGDANKARIERVETQVEELNKQMRDIPTRAEIAEMLSKSTEIITQSIIEKDQRTTARMENLEQSMNRWIELLLRDRINNSPRGK